MRAIGKLVDLPLLLTAMMCAPNLDLDLDGAPTEPPGGARPPEGAMRSKQPAAGGGPEAEAQRE